MNDMEQKLSEITCNPEIMSGAPVFRGTRVPVQNLIDYLNAGKSIEEFLDGFPSVERRQVIRVIEDVRDLAKDAA